MSSDITIIMYHYVRDFGETRFPRIKGLDVKMFCDQLNYLQKKFNIINYKTIRDYCIERAPLPPNPCWLTFDDGYIDHYHYVLPNLTRRGLSASFFPPAKVIEENGILSVNKIHYILASIDDPNIVIAVIRSAIEEGLSRVEGLKQFSFYWNEFAKRGRYDAPSIIFIKQMLQNALPFEFREDLINELFRKYVSSDLRDFSAGLYMSRDHLRELIDVGMHIGSHGYSHIWLNKVDPVMQADDIDRSLEFLDSIGARGSGDWAICYPYGGYNSTTLELLKKRNCLIGVTTVPSIASLSQGSLLELPRFDTNDFLLSTTSTARSSSF